MRRHDDQVLVGRRHRRKQGDLRRLRERVGLQGGCTTCMAVCGSGSRTVGTTTTMERRRTAALGLPAATAPSGSCAAVPGTSVPSGSAPRTAAEIPPTALATASGSAWPGRSPLESLPCIPAGDQGGLPPWSPLDWLTPAEYVRQLPAKPRRLRCPEPEQALRSKSCLRYDRVAFFQRGRRITVITPASQAGDVGSTPIARSKTRLGPPRRRHRLGQAQRDLGVASVATTPSGRSSINSVLSERPTKHHVRTACFTLRRGF